MRLLLILVPIVLVGVVVAVAELSRRQASRPLRGPDDRQFKNHQDMARWIERVLRDDYIRPSIPVEEQERARRLLGTFFGDPPDELP